MCVCVLGGEEALLASLNLLKQQKAGSLRTLSMEALMNMGQTPPASRCLQFDTGPKTDIHPYSHRALCTAQGTCCVKNMIWYLQKNICKWRSLGCP